MTYHWLVIERDEAYIAKFGEDPDHPERTYRIECSDPAACPGWIECFKGHDDVSDDDRDRGQDGEEVMIHGEAHTYRYGYGWCVDGDPLPWPGGGTIVRTYTPDPTPDQEVPRDEWANIAVGSRVRIVEVDGDEHTVTVDYVSPAADVVWLYDEDHDYDGAKIARVYLLDAPTPPDPDAELIEAMARAMYVSAEGWDGLERGTQECFRTYARRALDAHREAKS